MLPCLSSIQTYSLLTKGQTVIEFGCFFFLDSSMRLDVLQTNINGSNTSNSIWMDLERMKAAIKNQELLGLEPYYILKDILDRQQSHGWGIGIFSSFRFSFFIDVWTDLDRVISSGQIFEEPTLQFIECKQLDPNNPSSATPHEQLISTAKFTHKSTRDL